MRARNIKPGLYKNEHLAECSLQARYLFPGLWCLADREGRLEDRPKKIKAELFPFDDVDVDKLLEELNGKFILRYEVDGARCIQVVKFSNHQNPHFREAPSRLPAPPKKGQPEASPGRAPDKPRASPEKAVARPADSGFLIPDSLFSDSLNPSYSPSEGKKPKAAKERDELFDAIAAITGSDPQASGGHIGKVAAALRRMEPPCTVAEMCSLPDVLLKTMPYMAGTSLTLGMIEKYIGQVRSLPLALAARGEDIRNDLYRRQHEEALASRERRLKNQELNRQLAAKEVANGSHAATGPEGGEGPAGRAIAV